MCSSGGQVGQTDQALQASQAAMTTTLNDDYTQSFHDQQTVLANLEARANFIASNPFGYTPQQLAQKTTSINENTATAARQAMGSAAAFAAASWWRWCRYWQRCDRSNCWANRFGGSTEQSGTILGIFESTEPSDEAAEYLERD